MKLLLIWHAGGVDSYWQRIIELSNNFDEVKMLVPQYWNEGGKMLTSTNVKLRPNCEIIAGRTLMNIHGSTHFYVSALYRLLREFRPTVIHIHEEPWSIASYQVIFYSRLLKLEAKIIIDSAAISLKKIPIFSMFERYVYQYADFLYARNSEVKDVLHQRGCRKPVYLLPNGVDTSLFRSYDDDEVHAHRERLGISDGEVVIGYIGRMIAEKGIYDLLHAAKIVLQNGMKVKFLLVGSGEEQDQIHRFLLNNKLMDRFIVLEKLPSKEVPLYMNLIDLLVLPSKTTRTWKEQFGRVLVEAMACGKPVIGSSSGAIPEVINNERFIFPEGDPSQLADKIRELFDNRELLAEAVRNSRERVEHLYSWRALSDYYLKVLQEQQMMERPLGSTS